MSVVSSIALSGLRALDRRMEVTANNIANANTDGFKKSSTEFAEAYPSGVMVTISKSDAPGPLLPAEEGSTELSEGSNVDLEEEMINLVTTPLQYGLNVEVLKTEDELLGTLLDIIT
jgi:flagellar basal-body rod protein FlgB